MIIKYIVHFDGKSTLFIVQYSVHCLRDEGVSSQCLVTEQQYSGGTTTYRLISLLLYYCFIYVTRDECMKQCRSVNVLHRLSCSERKNFRSSIVRIVDILSHTVKRHLNNIYSRQDMTSFNDIYYNATQTDS